ncbi:MAG: lysophospholipid acyltransferase family protein [Anaerolineaceae bacterium]
MRRERIFKIIRKLAKTLSNLTVEGYENVPESGAFILVTNHISRLDMPFLMLSTSRQDTIGMAGDSYRKIAFFNWLLTSMGVIWVNRESYDFAAFREAADYLERGWIVGVAPEGTRSRTGELKKGKPGAALLARKTGVLLVPAAVTGSEEMTSRLTRLRKMDVRVRFGAPFRFEEPGPDEDNKAWLEKATEEMMCRIAALLPVERRGVYADHPRVAQILVETQQL